MPIDRTTREPKGVAYVAFSSTSSALSAYESLDKKSFQGRLLHILGAVDRKGGTRAEDGEGKKSTVKGEKDAKRKTGAGKEFNWGMLYMNVSEKTPALLQLHELRIADRHMSRVMPWSRQWLTG